MTDELKKKVERAIRLLQSAGKNGRFIEVSYSGGKDSDVILELARMSGINFRAIYKNTTIDPPGTIKHVKEQGAEIIRPKQTFFQLIAKSGFPTRRARFCCQILKEYKVLDYAVQGIRRSESTARAKRYKEPMICRLYGKDQHVNVILPILEWTDDDVAEFIQERHIQCAPVYYEGGGIQRKAAVRVHGLSYAVGQRTCRLQGSPKPRKSVVQGWQEVDGHSSER